METKEVNTISGVWILKKPKAGIRNRAMINAETDNGFKMTIFMTEILPKCVHKRPETFDDMVPIDQVLDGLDSDEYDQLFDAVKEWIISKKLTDTEEKKTKS